MVRSRRGWAAWFCSWFGSFGLLRFPFLEVGGVRSRLERAVAEDGIRGKALWSGGGVVC